MTPRAFGQASGPGLGGPTGEGPPGEVSLRRIVSLLDLTSLGEEDTEAQVRTLCDAAVTPLGSPAAVCIWPRFVQVAAGCLQALALAVRSEGGEGGAAGVRIATVANFPEGRADPEEAAAQTQAALALGAHEVDVVFPWRAFLAGDLEVGRRLVTACREACERAGVDGPPDAPQPLLKVILETGELGSARRVREAARIAADHGADFLKTSTGKVPVGATEEAVDALLEVIRERDGKVGLKVSGGVRTVEQAEAYLTQVREVMGGAWIVPRRMRFGASSLLGDILATGREGSSAGPVRESGE